MRNLRTRCSSESDGGCWKPNPLLEFFLSPSPPLCETRRSRRSLVFLALLSRFAGTYSCAVICVKSGRRRAAEDRKTEETETERFCLKRRTKWGTQRCGTRIPRVLGLARAPGMHRPCSLSLSLPLRRSVICFFLDLFVRLMMSLLDAKFRGSFGEPVILGGS